MEMSRLTDKVAIVTGASKGIGAGIAEALGAADARAAVNYSCDRKGAERVAQTIVLPTGFCSDYANPKYPLGPETPNPLCRGDYGPDVRL